MLSAVKGAGPQGAELEAFLSMPCHHMARLIRDLCEPRAVRESLKDVLKFIKDVRSPEPWLCKPSYLSHPSEGDQCSVKSMLNSDTHCHCQPHAMHFLHSRPDVIVGSDATMLCWLALHQCIPVTVP